MFNRMTNKAVDEKKMHIRQRLLTSENESKMLLNVYRGKGNHKE